MAFTASGIFGMKFFFALLGVALAAHSSLPVARPLNPKNEYRYSYESTLTYSIPVPNTESSLTRIRAEVIIHEPSATVSLLRLDNIEVASANDVTSENGKFETLEKRSLSEEDLRRLKLPFRVDHENSVVTEMDFSSEELPWTLNVKKAIVNMMQVNLKQANLEQKYFITNEKTIEGECEVAYTAITEGENQDTATVTKSVNFEKCVRRPGLPYSQEFALGCPDCDFNMIVPQTVYYYKFEKEQLKEVEVRSTYSISLKDQPMMKTENYGRLVFLGTNEIRHKMLISKGRKEELIYSTEWENSVEKFFKMGDDSDYNPFDKYTRKVEVVEDIVSSLSNIEENTPESVHFFTRLAHVLRRYTQDELRSVHDRVWKTAGLKEKTMILHALAVAGTKNTVEHLLTRHAEMMTPLKLAQLLKSIQETPYPSEQIAELLYKFTKTELCRSEPVIRQSAWLAYGTVVRGVVVPTMEMTFVEDIKLLKKKFVANLRKNWEDAETIYEKILALKTLANAGIDISIGDLETIIYDKKQPTAVRMEAIDALRLLNEQLPHRIQKILMPIYNNRFEKSEIRMASLVQMLQAKPQQPELYQIVQRMERESNRHLATFTYTLLKSYSESTLPVFRSVSTLLAPMLRVSQFRPERRLLSVYQRLPWFNEESFTGLNLNFGAIIGKDSVIPKDMMTSLETVFGGNWNKYLLQFGFSQQNVERLFNKLMSKLNLLQKNAKTTVRASRLSHSILMLKELARKLNIRVRDSSSEEAHAMLYLRYKQMDYAFLPLNENIIDELIEKYLRDGSIGNLMEEYSKEMEFDFTHAGFFFESRFRMPTTAGFPLTISAKLPTVFSATGKVTLRTGNNALQSRLQAQPTLSTTHIYIMSTPIFEHGIKMVRSAQIAIPIDLEFVADMEKLKLSFHSKMPEKSKTLIRVESRPVVFIREFNRHSDRYTDAKEKTILLPAFAKNTEDRTMIREWLGLEFVLSGINNHPLTLENVVLGEHHMELAVRPTSRVSERIGITFYLGRVSTTSMDKHEAKKLLLKGVDDDKENTQLRNYIQKRFADYKLDTLYQYPLSFSLSAVEQIEVSLQLSCDGKLSFCQLNTSGRGAGKTVLAFDSNSILFFPQAVSSIQELKGCKNTEIKLFSKKTWMTAKNEKSKIQYTVDVKQSEDQRKLVMESMSLRGLPANELLSRMARLNEINAVVNYELNPESELMFDRLFDLLKSYNVWNSQLEHTRNEPRRVRAEFTVDPLDSKVSQLTVETPTEVLRLDNINMPLPLPSLSGLRDEERALSEESSYNQYPKEDSIDADSGEIYRDIKKKFQSTGEQTLTTDLEMNIRVQEFAHRTCFSLAKVPECPKNYISGKPVEQKIRFGCLPRHNADARRLLSAIRRGDDIVLEDYVEDLKLSFVDNILIPHTCVSV